MIKALTIAFIFFTLTVWGAVLRLPIWALLFPISLVLERPLRLTVLLVLGLTVDALSGHPFGIATGAFLLIGALDSKVRVLLLDRLLLRGATIFGATIVTAAIFFFSRETVLLFSGNALAFVSLLRTSLSPIFLISALAGSALAMFILRLVGRRNLFRYDEKLA